MRGSPIGLMHIAANSHLILCECSWDEYRFLEWVVDSILLLIRLCR